MDDKFEYINIDALNESLIDEILEIENEVFPNPYDERMVRAIVNDKNGLMVGCFLDEKLIGYVQVLRNLYSNDDLVIVNLAVIEKFRGKGIAKSLLYKACNYFESNEFTPVILQVRKDNEIAIKLYKNLGFMISKHPSKDATKDDYEMFTFKKVLNKNLKQNKKIAKRK